MDFEIFMWRIKYSWIFQKRLCILLHNLFFEILIYLNYSISINNTIHVEGAKVLW